MDFAQERSGEVEVVRLSGRLDSGTAQLAEERFARALAGGATRLAVDMSGLDYVSSAGLRVLLVTAKKIQKVQGGFVLFGLLPNVREVFAISGFDTIFTIEPDAAAALARLR